MINYSIIILNAMYVDVILRLYITKKLSFNVSYYF